jgi:hypothetical protein
MELVIQSQLDGVSIAAGQGVGFVLIASLPDGPHGMDHFLGRQVTCSGNHRLAGRAFAAGPANFLTIFQDLGTAFSMDSAVDASSSQ